MASTDDIQAAVQALAKSSKRSGQSLPIVDPVGGIAAKRGRGTYTAPAGTGTAGIASPLTETPGTRAYFAGGIPSSDGLFEFPSIQQQTFTDANDGEVIIDYSDPTA